jgi:peptide/nickel transport system permease protein
MSNITPQKNDADNTAVEPQKSVLGAKKDDVLTPGKIIWKRFRRNKLAIVGLYILIFLILISVFAPLLANHDRDAFWLPNKEMEPSREHWFGTDIIGRDVYTRTLYGGRVSLTVGVVATAIQLILGIILGAAAGYFGGWIDNIIMRLTDIVLSFPFLAIAITMAAILGPSIYTTMIVIGFLSWTSTCRLIRGQFSKGSIGSFAKKKKNN